MPSPLADVPDHRAQVHRLQPVLLEKRPPQHLLGGVFGERIAQADRWGAGYRGLPADKGRLDGALEFRIVYRGVVQQYPEVEKSFMRVFVMPSTVTACSFSATTVAFG